MQGRVMALHQMAWFGSTPIGALAMGGVIQATSPRVPFVLGAIAAFACAVAVTRAVRRPEGPATDPKVVVAQRGTVSATG